MNIGTRFHWQLYGINAFSYDPYRIKDLKPLTVQHVKAALQMRTTHFPGQEVIRGIRNGDGFFMVGTGKIDDILLNWHTLGSV